MMLVFGCNSSIVQLQKTQPKGSKFHTYLAKEYLNFSEEEAYAYDWFDSSHFARKGKKLAKGEYIPPENLMEWNIDKDSFAIMHQAREYLIDVLTADVMVSYPKDAAKLQFFFDCWVEQQEEAWQDTHIAYCREKFYDKLDAIYSRISSDKEADILHKKQEAERLRQAMIAQKMAEEKEKIKLNPVEEEVLAEYKTTVMRSVYFKYNDYNLNKSSKKVISKMARKLAGRDDYSITINGYADRSGREEYNMSLSRKRALEAKGLFVENGAAEENIAVFAFGEISGMVETSDGTAEAANRIVEIILEY